MLSNRGEDIFPREKEPSSQVRCPLELLTRSPCYEAIGFVATVYAQHYYLETNLGISCPEAGQKYSTASMRATCTHIVTAE